MGKTYLIFGIFFIFILNFVNAAQIPIEGTPGLIINSWADDNAISNTQYTILWDVSSYQGNLYNNTETNCTFFIYKAGTFGTYIAGAANRTTVGGAWYKTIPSTFINSTGVYNYQMDCYLVSNTSISGSYLAQFTATPSGKDLTTQEAIIMLGSVFLIILISLLFYKSGSDSENKVAKLTFYTFAVIFMLMAILFLVVIAQQTLFGFSNILTGVETFWFVAKMGMTLGIVIFFVIIFLMMLKYWKIKRGLID